MAEGRRLTTCQILPRKSRRQQGGVAKEGLPVTLQSPKPAIPASDESSRRVASSRLFSRPLLSAVSRGDLCAPCVFRTPGSDEMSESALPSSCGSVLRERPADG